MLLGGGGGGGGGGGLISIVRPFNTDQTIAVCIAYFISSNLVHASSNYQGVHLYSMYRFDPYYK